MSAYGSRKVPKPLRRETDAERATRLVMQAHVSEQNRWVKLAARPDAEAKLAAAQTKRARKSRKRNWDASSAHAANPRWYTA